MVDCTLHTAVVHVASPTRCSVSRVIPPFSEREKIRARSRRGGVVVSGSGGIKNRMVRNLSIAVKIGREIRWLWPTVIERGGRVGEYVARRRCATRQRGGERVNGGRERGSVEGQEEWWRRGSASSAISSMVHGVPVHGAVMHIMGGMCTCRRSQLFDTAAARYTCRRYLSHASRMGPWLTPSFPTRFRLPPCPPFVRLLLIDKLAGPGQNDQRRDDRSWNA